MGATEQNASDLVPTLINCQLWRFCSATGNRSASLLSWSTFTVCKSPRQLEHLSFVIGHAQGGPVHAGRLNANRQGEQTMSAQTATAAQQYRSAPRQFRSAANPVKRREYATLIVDRQGNICGCGTAAEDILGASQSRLLGRRISTLVADLFREGSSPGHSARHLDRLCADNDWRKFEVTDACGRGFAVEINVSRRMADGGEVFVLSLRRPGEAT